MYNKITYSVHNNEDDTYGVTIRLGNLVVCELRNIDYFEVGTIVQLAKYMYDTGYEQGKDHRYE